MNNEFKKILNILEKLNKHTNPKIIASELLKKEYRRINDLTLLDKNSKKHLALLNKITNKSIDTIMQQICHLDVQLDTYVWHVECIKNITQKFIKYYKKNLS